MFVKESTAAVEVAASTDMLTSVSAVDAADSADAADVTDAADAAASADAADGALVEVAVIRVDHSGNLYHKT
jgi:hypothetical protein